MREVHSMVCVLAVGAELVVTWGPTGYVRNERLDVIGVGFLGPVRLAIAPQVWGNDSIPCRH